MSRHNKYSQNVSQYGVDVPNNRGGHHNHTFFWNILSHQGGGLPSGKGAGVIY